MEAADPLALTTLAASFGLSVGVFVAILIAVSIWTLVLKGFALWHAGREGQATWFIMLLILNTFGILEIVYLLFFRPKDEEEGSSSEEQPGA